MVAKDLGNSVNVLPDDFHDLVEMDWMPIGNGSPDIISVVYGVPRSKKSYDLSPGAATRGAVGLAQTTRAVGHDGGFGRRVP